MGGSERRSFQHAFYCRTSEVWLVSFCEDSAVKMEDSTQKTNLTSDASWDMKYLMLVFKTKENRKGKTLGNLLHVEHHYVFLEVYEHDWGVHIPQSIELRELFSNVTIHAQYSVDFRARLQALCLKSIMRIYTRFSLELRCRSCSPKEGGGLLQYSTSQLQNCTISVSLSQIGNHSRLSYVENEMPLQLNINEWAKVRHGCTPRWRNNFTCRKSLFFIWATQTC